MAKGDLFSLIQNKSETVRWENKGIDIALDIARAVAVLHENCIIHRDLKTPNILVRPLH
jgi:serine/threonine protein kinase